jgi:hypothetical protein
VREKIPSPLSRYFDYTMIQIEMKDMQRNITKIIIALVTLKCIDFQNMGILDYMIVILAVALLIMMIANAIRRNFHAKR